MAITTDFIGHIGIEPALDVDQIDHLTILREVGPGRDGPPLRSGWVASDDGASLTVKGDDTYGDPAQWLRYLIKRYVKPAGLRAEGLVVGCRRDTKELWAIQVTANRVSEKALWPRRTASPGAPRRPAPAPRTSAPNVVDLATRRARA